MHVYNWNVGDAAILRTPPRHTLAHPHCNLSTSSSSHLTPLSFSPLSVPSSPALVTTPLLCSPQAVPPAKARGIKGYNYVTYKGANYNQV